MIVCSKGYSKGYQEIKGQAGDRVTFSDDYLGSRQITFNISRNGIHLASVSGSHARDMLIAFLRQGNDIHLKRFKEGIEEELEYREKENGKTKNHA